MIVNQNTNVDYELMVRITAAQMEAWILLKNTRIVCSSVKKLDWRSQAFRRIAW